MGQCVLLRQARAGVLSLPFEIMSFTFSAWVPRKR